MAADASACVPSSVAVTDMFWNPGPPLPAARAGTPPRPANRAR